MRILWLKYQILIYIEELKTIEVRAGVYKTKNVYIITNLKISVYTVIEQAFKVFD